MKKNKTMSKKKQIIELKEKVAELLSERRIFISKCSERICMQNADINYKDNEILALKKEIEKLKENIIILSNQNKLKEQLISKPSNSKKTKYYVGQKIDKLIITKIFKNENNLPEPPCLNLIPSNDVKYLSESLYNFRKYMQYVLEMKKYNELKIELEKENGEKKGIIYELFDTINNKTIQLEEYVIDAIVKSKK